MIKNLMNKINNKKNKKGFTLIELIIVIAIIAILAALLLPKLGAVKENSNKTSDIANAKKIAEAALSLNAEEKLQPGTFTVGANTTLDNYLQSTPVTKSNVDKGSSFVVVLETDGSVSVTANSKSLYPTIDSAYNSK